MPTITSGSAKRYTEAVFRIAEANHSFDRWEAELERIAGLVETPELAAFLSAPAVGMMAKDTVLVRLLDGVSPEASNLVKLLLRKGKLALAPQIAAHYRDLLNSYRGIVTAEVVSAVPLNGEEKKAIARRLSQMTGRQVLVQDWVDSSIIGGIVARVGYQLIDDSVKGRLEALKKRLAPA